MHWIEGGGEHRGPASTYAGDSTLAYSGIAMKAGRPGSLRSQSQEEFDQVGEDANSNLGRPGTYPDDYFFSGPCVPGGDCPGGPGWTGYEVVLDVFDLLLDGFELLRDCRTAATAHVIIIN